MSGQKRGAMGKLLAVTIIVIAIASAIPVVMHTWEAPPNISTHGKLIDDQMGDTMIEAGVSFLASQILLALFIWQFSKPRPQGKIKTFPGGAKGLVLAAIILVGVEVLALGVFGVKAWAHPQGRTPCQSRFRPGSSLSIFAIPVQTENSDRSTRN